MTVAHGEACLMCCGKQVGDVISGVQMWPEMVMTPYKPALRLCCTVDIHQSRLLSELFTEAPGLDWALLPSPDLL